jgi:hypothetical protein
MAIIETEPQNFGSDQHPISEKGKALRNLVEADLLDDRYATTTKRGLKNRHVQLMALGGTIGTGRSAGLRPEKNKITHVSQDFSWVPAKPWPLEAPHRFF